MMFRLIHELVGARVAKMVVMISLGTAPADERRSPKQRLENFGAERSNALRSSSRSVQTTHGTIAPQLASTSAIFQRQEIRELSGGLV
jgi:hypothetical protein